MSETSLAFETKIVHSGIFDFKDLYGFLYEWLSNLQYIVIEQKYSEKIKPLGKEVEIAWLCLRKINDYIRYKVKVGIKVLKMVDVEVTEDGVKIKKNKGDVEVKFAGFLERDYENKWEQNPISKFFRGIYDKYLVPTRIEDYEDRLGDELSETSEQFKAYLSLEGRKR